MSRQADGLGAHAGAASFSAVGQTCGVTSRDAQGISHTFEDDDLIVVIYGYPSWHDLERQAAAKRDGHGAIAARLYRDRGPGLLEHLHGTFAICVIEKAAQRGLLAIDRFGVETLCYAQVPNGPLVFGSTTDSVRAFPGMSATILPQTIYNYLYFIDRVCAPATIYQEQKKLLPGQYLTLEDGVAGLDQYWRMTYQSDRTTPESQLHEALLEQLRGAFRRSTDGEDLAQAGAFLSGGLDSSTVLSLFAEASERRAKAFTIGFKEQEYDETGYAAIAARHVGAAHDIFELEPSHMLETIPKLVRAYDEPFANSSVVPAYYCALRAREAGVDVLLAGDGGDELFAGNSRYLKDRVFQIYRRLPRRVRESVLEPLVLHLPMRDRINLFRRANNYFRQARMSVPVRMTSTNLYGTRNYQEVFAPDAVAQIDPDQPKAFVEEIFFGVDAESNLQRMMALDLRITLADGDLRKVGRACQLAGVRVRYPLLDDDLAAFAARVPPRLLDQGGRLRAFYKDAVKPILAPETIAKEKHGFGLPTFEYINRDKPLQDLFGDYLSDLKRRKLFRPDFVDGLVRHLRSGNSQAYCGATWDLGVLEIWLQSRAPGAF